MKIDNSMSILSGLDYSTLVMTASCASLISSSNTGGDVEECNNLKSVV